MAGAWTAPAACSTKQRAKASASAEGASASAEGASASAEGASASAGGPSASEEGAAASAEGAAAAEGASASAAGAMAAAEATAAFAEGARGLRLGLEVLADVALPDVAWKSSPKKRLRPRARKGRVAARAPPPTSALPGAMTPKGEVPLSLGLRTTAVCSNDACNKWSRWLTSRCTAHGPGRMAPPTPMPRS